MQVNVIDPKKRKSNFPDIKKGKGKQHYKELEKF